MVFLVIAFILVPIVELYVIIQVGEAIGVWPTLALLLGDALLGALLLRHQGRGAWRRFNEALAQRRFPAREVADGLMIAIGATLLLTPGFVTDIFGFILLIPPTRALVRRFLGFYLGRQLGRQPFFTCGIVFYHGDLLGAFSKCHKSGSLAPATSAHPEPG